MASQVRSNGQRKKVDGTGGELGVLRVREHPLSAQVHPLTAKSTPSKQKKNIIKHHFKPVSNKYMVIEVFIGVNR